MPFIPVTETRESARQAPPQTQASGEAFGAGVGRALQGLGQTIAGVGASFAGIGGERERQTRAINTTEFWANSDFTPIQVEAFNEAPLGGQGYAEGLLAKHDAFSAAKLEEYSTLHPGDKKGADLLRLKFLEERRRISEGGWADQQTMASTASEIDARTGLDTSLNAIRTDPTNFDGRLKDGIDLINARPGYNAAKKADAIAVYTSQASLAYFEGKLHAAESSPDPLAAMEAIRQEIGTEAWEKRFLQPHYEALVNAIDSNMTQAGNALRSIYKGQLTDYVARSNATKITDPETALIGEQDLAALGENIGKYGDANDREAYGRLLDQQRTYREYRGMSNQALEDAANGVVTGVFNRTEATGFLQSQFKNIPAANIAALDARMQTRLGNMLSAMPPALRAQVKMYSAYRTVEDQQRAIKQVAGRSPAAPPGRSHHQFGRAVDINWASPAAKKWMYDNAGAYGLVFPMPNSDAGHLQLKEASGEPRGVEEARAYQRGVGISGGTDGTVRGALNIPPSVAPIIVRTAQAFGHSAGLMGGIWRAESSGSLNPGTSPKGAEGPFQIMPKTKAYIEQLMGKPFDVNNFEQAAEASSFYMKYLKERPWINGDERLAIMAYNWGEGNVKEWLEKGSNWSDVPKETQDYLAKVQGYMAGAEGGWEGAANMPNPSGYAGPNMTNSEFNKYQDIQKMIADQTSANNSDMMGQAMVNPIPMMPAPTPIGPNSITPEAFVQRSQYAEQYAQFHGIAPDNVKPFSTEEMSYMQTIMNGNDEAVQLALMGAIGGMSSGMQDYAYTQLGTKNPSFAIAGDRYHDSPDTALSILRGSKDLIANPNRAKAWGTEDDFLTAYNESVGDAFAMFNADTQAAMPEVVKAIYADMTRLTPTAELDTDKLDQAIAQAWGMKIEVVNGVKTFLPPDVEATDLQNWTTVARDVDWAANSVDKSFPIDANGDPVEMEELAGATFHAVDNQGNYQVAISDGLIFSGIPAPSNEVPRPFVMHITSAMVQEGLDAARTDGVEVPGETDPGVPVLPAEPWGGKRNDPADPNYVDPYADPAAAPAPIPSEATPAEALPPVSGMGMPVSGAAVQEPVGQRMRERGLATRDKDDIRKITPSVRANSRGIPPPVPPAPRAMIAPATDAEIRQRSAQIAHDGYKIVLDGMDFDQETKDRLLKDYMDTYHPDWKP